MWEAIAKCSPRVPPSPPHTSLFLLQTSTLTVCRAANDGLSSELSELRAALLPGDAPAFGVTPGGLTVIVAYQPIPSGLTPVGDSEIPQHTPTHPHRLPPPPRWGLRVDCVDMLHRRTRCQQGCTGDGGILTRTHVHH